MPATTLHVDESRQKLTSAAIVAGIILAGGLYFAPNRAWGNLLVGVFYLLSIALGGTVYLALTYLSGAGWHVAFRRVFPRTVSQPQRGRCAERQKSWNIAVPHGARKKPSVVDIG